METTKKVSQNSKRAYKKKEHPRVTLNVNKFLAFAKTEDIPQWSVDQLLVHYLKNHRDAEFTSYGEIASALRKEYGRGEKECSKGTMSKVCNRFLGDWVFDDGVYFLEKIDGVYKLRPRFSKQDPLLEKLFRLKNAFKDDRIYELNRFTFVLSVNAEKAKTLKEIFFELLGTSLCFGIMTHEEHLIIMLDKSNPRASEGRDLMLGFFKRKKEYERHLKDKAVQNSVLNERNERIRQQQKKYKNHSSKFVK